MAGRLSIMSGRAVLKKFPKRNDLGERIITKLCKVCRSPHRQRYEDLFSAGFTCRDLSRQAQLYREQISDKSFANHLRRHWAEGIRRRRLGKKVYRFQRSIPRQQVGLSRGLQRYVARQRELKEHPEGRPDLIKVGRYEW